MCIAGPTRVMLARQAPMDDWYNVHEYAYRMPWQTCTGQKVPSQHHGTDCLTDLVA